LLKLFTANGHHLLINQVERYCSATYRSEGGVGSSPPGMDFRTEMQTDVANLNVSAVKNAVELVTNECSGGKPLPSPQPPPPPHNLGISDQS